MVKLTINYTSIRRICVQRLKRDAEIVSFKDNIKFNKLKRLAVDYLPKVNEKKDDADTEKKTGDNETNDNSPDEKHGNQSNKNYQDYDVTITYFDEDGDEIDISSGIELTEALENLKRTSHEGDTFILYANAIVKRAGEEGDVSPLTNIRMAYMKRCASQWAKAASNKTRNRGWSSSLRHRNIFFNKFVQKPPRTEGKKSPQGEQKKDQTKEFDPAFCHTRHECDGCSVSPIIGFRYRATNIPNYDLCQTCKETYDADGKTDMIFRKAQQSCRSTLAPHTSHGLSFYQDDKELADAIKLSLATLVEDDTKRELGKDQHEDKQNDDTKNEDEEVHAQHLTRLTEKLAAQQILGWEGSLDNAESNCEVAGGEDTVEPETENDEEDDLILTTEKQCGHNEGFLPVATLTSAAACAHEITIVAEVLEEPKNNMIARSVSDDEWDVVSDCTESLDTDLETGDNSGDASFSVNNNVLLLWGKELTQLRELGFKNEVECAEVLETLFAANVGCDNDEPVTVEHAVHYIMTKLR